MPPGQTTPGASGSTGASPASTGASPATGSSPTSSEKTLNIGMGPQKSAPSTSSTPATDPSGRLSGDQLFTDYGEEIFKHPRFKELTDAKKKYAPLEPLLNSWQDPIALVQFEEFLGPVWKAMNSKGTDQANAYWGKLLPIFQAIMSGQDITPFLAAIAGANQTPPVEEDPIQKDIKALQNKVTQFETEKQRNEETARRKGIENHKIGNVQKYETSFHEWADRDKIPADKDTRKRLGDILAANMYKYMPKVSVRNQAGHLVEVPQNALLTFNLEALQKCYEGEILPFYQSLSESVRNGVIQKVEGGGPAIPNTNNQGTTVTGSSVPPNRRQKAARLSQFISARTP